MASILYLLCCVIPIIISLSINILSPINSNSYELIQQVNIDLYIKTSNCADKICPTALSEKDFIIQNHNTYLALGDKFTELITEENILNTRYADEKHAYNVYVFENFILSTQPFEEGIVFRIYLVAPFFKTSRGVGVGDSVSDVIEKYGLNYEALTNTIYYHYKGKLLIFNIEEKSGKVISIQYEFI